MIKRTHLLISCLFLLGITSLITSYVLVEDGPDILLSCPKPTEWHAPYKVIDTKGLVTETKELFSKPTLLFFGFTYCPEICPTTLSDISRWLYILGPNADKLEVLFVTIDPDRDTPEHLGQYLGAFDKRIHGLLLPPCAVADLAKRYGVFFRKIQLDDHQYAFDHTANILLLNRSGIKVGSLDYQVSDEVAVTRLKTLSEQ